jgi:hypothetical protein
MFFVYYLKFIKFIWIDARLSTSLESEESSNFYKVVNGFGITNGCVRIKHTTQYLRFEILTAALLKIQIFWDVLPYLQIDTL